MCPLKLARNSAAISNMAPPQIVGNAVRPSASEGSFSRGEITTPNDHDKEPSNTASTPDKLDPLP